MLVIFDLFHVLNVLMHSASTCLSS